MTFNEKTVLNRAKLNEILNTKASIDFNDDNGIFDSTSNGDGDLQVSQQQQSTDNSNHSANQDSTGIHSTDKDSVGNSRDTIYSINSDDTGNISDQPRRGTRDRKQPDRLGIAHFALSAQQYVGSEPESIEEAKQRDDWHKWKQAIDTEYESLMNNNTRTLCDLPENRKAISCKWVFKIKRKSNGDIDKYKARMVARNIRTGR